MNVYRRSSPERRVPIAQLIRGLHRRVREVTLLGFDRWLALFDATARDECSPTASKTCDDTVVRQIYMPSRSRNRPIIMPAVTPRGHRRWNRIGRMAVAGTAKSSSGRPCTAAANSRPIAIASATPLPL
jgi:hypothetical protein